MFKFAIKLLAFGFFLSSSTVNASLITNLSDVELDNKNYANAVDHLTMDLLNIHFINYGDWDFVWASPINTADYYGQNTLHNPEIQKNWMFAEESDEAFYILHNVLTIEHFTGTDSSGSTYYIHAAEYFNSNFSYVDVDDFGMKRSQHVAEDDIFKAFKEQYETFYVRSVADRPTAEVPEPATLMIFAVALIALSMRTRLAK